ncbi:MAG TPA: hypothetical protein VMJ73_16460 [Rhizomicrobium sp.]|nr:hypothetical protein [Rhizomicrobium sp.]
MFRRSRLERQAANRYAPRNAGTDLALAATLVFFGVIPIGVVSAMMLMQIFGIS